MMGLGRMRMEVGGIWGYAPMIDLYQVSANDSRHKPAGQWSKSIVREIELTFSRFWRFTCISTQISTIPGSACGCWEGGWGSD